MADKNSPIRRRRSLPVQIVGDRPPCLDWQREQIGAAGLALGDAQGPCPPVQIVQLQSGDLGCAQAKVGQAAHHGVGPLARGNGITKGAEELIDLHWREHVRQTGQAPVRRDRDGLRQRANRITGKAVKSEITAQGAGHHLDGSRSPPPAIAAAQHKKQLSSAVVSSASASGPSPKRSVRNAPTMRTRWRRVLAARPRTVPM